MNMMLCGGKSTPYFLQEALEMVDQPRVLIVPSARITAGGFQDRVEKYKEFFTGLGVVADLLNEFEQVPTANEVQDKFGASNFIHTLGGDTVSLLDRWAHLGLGDEIQKFLDDSNKIYTGSSAGALAVFRHAHIGPSRYTKPERTTFSTREGLGILEALGAVHVSSVAHYSDKTRFEHFKNSLIPGIVGVALDDHTALMVRDGKVKASYIDGQSERIRCFVGGKVDNQEIVDTTWAHPSSLGLNIN